MSETSPDKSPLEAFLEQYWKDRGADDVRSIADYIQQFPGDADAIAAEFTHLQERQAPSPTSDDDSSIGPYRTISELGRGGQGVVYLAEDSRLKRRVALKVLSNLGPGSEDTVQRFRREAELASKLNHPGICGVHDAGLESGVPYIAMQYVEGETLADRIAKARADATEPEDSIISFDVVDHEVSADTTAEDEVSAAGTSITRVEVDRVLEMFEKAARALHAAHEAGVIHRDIKPGNIIVSRDAQPVVLDFGLARSDDMDVQTLTRTGDLFGTPAYMSPEQLTRGSIRLDRRTDVYSLGATLYECLTLKRPFEAPTREALYQVIMTRDAADPRKLNPQIPPELKVVLETALEKDRDRRYQTAEELANELKRVRLFEPIQARSIGRVLRVKRWTQRNPAAAAAACSVILGLVVAMFLWRQAVGAERQAAAERDRADEKAAEAQASADEAKRTLGEWRGLIDTQLLKNLIARANASWPATPDRIPSMDRWLEDATRLADRLPDHRSTLLALRAKARPYDEEQRRKDRATYGEELKRIADIGAWLQRIDARAIALPQEIDRARTTIKETQAKAKSGKSTPNDQRIIEFGTRRIAICERLLERNSEARAALLRQREALNARASERTTWVLDTPKKQIRHNELSHLTRALVQLTSGAAPGTPTIASMKRRIAFARASGQEHENEWADCIDRIARSPKYSGLRFTRQWSLVPLGADPDSGLEEFSELQTGVIPVRDPETKKLLINEQTGLVFVLLPGGSFTMGEQKADPEKPHYHANAAANAAPHVITLAPFFMSKYEMTQGQWLRTTGANPSHVRPRRHLESPSYIEDWEDDVTLMHPVDWMDWAECDALLRRLGVLVPTEAQWEYACRAGTHTTWWTGDTETSLRAAANLKEGRRENEWKDGHQDHSPVGALRANAFGLHDVHGNVSEVCRDYRFPYSAPVRAGDGFRGIERVPGGQYESGRVRRGGDYRSSPSDTRSARRRRYAESLGAPRGGVRPSRALAR